jgi:hypothetical protein
MFTSGNTKAHIKEQLLSTWWGIGKFRNYDVAHG